jgi:iron-sulfur cluster assembly accessory protein
LTFNWDPDNFAALFRKGEFPFDPRASSGEGETMVILTPEAIAKVKSILTERNEDAGLRIAVVGGGCSGFQYQMTLDKDPQEDDKVLDMEGLRVFIDMKSFLYLNGATVSFVEDAEESGFKFDNPNANDSCGCGETFEA